MRVDDGGTLDGTRGLGKPCWLSDIAGAGGLSGSKGQRYMSVPVEYRFRDGLVDMWVSIACGDYGGIESRWLLLMMPWL
jgi:hypothetical protein